MVVVVMCCGIEGVVGDGSGSGSGSGRGMLQLLHVAAVSCLLWRSARACFDGVRFIPSPSPSRLPENISRCTARVFFVPLSLSLASTCHSYHLTPLPTTNTPTCACALCHIAMDWCAYPLLPLLRPPIAAGGWYAGRLDGMLIGAPDDDFSRLLLSC